MSFPAFREGFTLLEILVAFSILAVAVVLILQLFSADLRNISRSGGITMAAAKGDARMREILSFASLEEKYWSEITDDGYRFDIAVAEVLKDRTETLQVKMMEVVLTVHWLEGPRERSLRMRTARMMDKLPPADKTGV